MEYVERAFRALGPVVLGGFLLAIPLVLAPRPAQAVTSTCAGYDTVECSTLEYCVGIKYFGAGLCVTNVTYWPHVRVHLQEALEDALEVNLMENMGDYVHGAEGGGGGAF